MFRWLDDIPFAPGMVVWFLLLVGGAWVGDTIGNAPDGPVSLLCDSCKPGKQLSRCPVCQSQSDSPR